MLVRIPIGVSLVGAVVDSIGLKVVIRREILLEDSRVLISHTVPFGVFHVFVVRSSRRVRTIRVVVSSEVLPVETVTFSLQGRILALRTGVTKLVFLALIAASADTSNVPTLHLMRANLKLVIVSLRAIRAKVSG